MNIYRKHIRHKKHDYSSPCDYFVTICSFQFFNIFSKIENHTVNILPVGQIIESCWNKLPEYFPNIKLGQYVIMPNHFHGIITVKKMEPLNHMTNCPKGITSLARIIRLFKSQSSYLAMKNFNRKDSIWQKNYYEQIIKDEFHYYFVEEYIMNNPKNWHVDTLFHN